MSPKNLQIIEECLSVVLPDAPIHNNAGNTNVTHTVSYIPLMWMPLFSLRYGIENNAISINVHIQNALYDCGNELKRVELNLFETLK